MQPPPAEGAAYGPSVSGPRTIPLSLSGGSLSEPPGERRLDALGTNGAGVRETLALVERRWEGAALCATGSHHEMGSQPRPDRANVAGRRAHAVGHPRMPFTLAFMRCLTQ